MTPHSIRQGLKVYISLITVFYGLVPAIADLNETHLYNPLWSEHARFHGVWFLSFSGGVALTVLYLTWTRDEILLPTVVGLMFVAGFWIAVIFRSYYGGALTDYNGVEQQLFGIESNLFIFATITVLLFISLFSVKFFSQLKNQMDE